MIKMITAERCGARRVCFTGVSSGSRLGIALKSATETLRAEAYYDAAAHGTKKWREAVRGTDLQWWDEERCPPRTTSFEPAPDIVVDLFGNRQIDADKTRVWSIVDSSGEPLLNPFFLLNACCRSPYVASIFLVEAIPQEQHWTIIGEAHISSRQKYRRLLNRVAGIAARLIGSALRDRDALHEKAGSIVVKPCERTRFRVAAGFVSARLRHAAVVAKETLFNEYWAIGVLDAKPNSVVRSRSIAPNYWITPSQRNAYFADPFPSPDEPEAVLCERFDYLADCGALCVVNIASDGTINEQPMEINVRSRHFSYPFTFREDDRVLLLPEMAASGELLLLELSSQRTASTVCRVDVGTQNADPTLFHYGGLYWIAYCDQGFGSCDNLCLLYADRLEGPWTHHPKNPVKIDIRSSRPGGTPFWHHGKFLRPAQDCSWTYGGAVVLNEVVVCTPTDYAERPIATLSPDRNGPFPDGLHTLSLSADRILIDGKKLILDPRRAWKRLRSYARQHWHLRP